MSTTATKLKIGDLVMWPQTRPDRLPELGVVCAMPSAASLDSRWVARVSDTGDPMVWGWSAWVSDDEVQIVTDLSTIPLNRLLTAIGLGATHHGPALIAEARRRQAERDAAAGHKGERS